MSGSWWQFRGLGDLGSGLVEFFPQSEASRDFVCYPSSFIVIIIIAIIATTDITAIIAIIVTIVLRVIIVIWLFAVPLKVGPWAERHKPDPYKTHQNLHFGRFLLLALTWIFCRDPT